LEYQSSFPVYLSPTFGLPDSCHLIFLFLDSPVRAMIYPSSRAGSSSRFFFVFLLRGKTQFFHCDGNVPFLIFPPPRFFVPLDLLSGLLSLAGGRISYPDGNSSSTQPWPETFKKFFFHSDVPYTPPCPSRLIVF